MKKKEDNLEEPITKGFFIRYMDDFANAIARGFNDEREFVNIRFDQVDKKFDQVDKRFDQIDKRFEQVDKRFEQVDYKIDQMGNRISMETSSIRSEMRSGFEKVNIKLDKLDQKVEFYNKQRMIDDEAIISDIDGLKKKHKIIEKKIAYIA